jgi:hypothetical protein
MSLRPPEEELRSMPLLEHLIELRARLDSRGRGLCCGVCHQPDVHASAVDVRLPSRRAGVDRARISLAALRG